MCNKMKGQNYLQNWMEFLIKSNISNKRKCKIKSVEIIL